MRVFVTGAAGQVGREVVEAFDGHQVVAPDHAQLDIADRAAVLQALLAATPDVIVHTAAWTAVDDCERDPDRALQVNALGTRHVADGARLVGAHVVYLSTDYVFDGTSPAPYTEWDDPNPLSVYGRSKLGGERELDPGATIVRTSWVAGRHGRNFVKTVLQRLEAGADLDVVDDQHGYPTFAADLASMLRRLAVDRLPGCFHVTNQGPTTWFAFARDIARAGGWDTERVRPISTDEQVPPRPATRPANSLLDNAALKLQGVPLLPDHHDPLERLVKELLST